MGDVLSACQSANLRWDIFSPSSVEDTYQIPRISDVQRGDERDGSSQPDNRRNRGKGGSYGKTSSRRGSNSSGNQNQKKKKEDPIGQFCKEFKSPSGCNVMPCSKKHSCSRRHPGGIFCNQKTHGRPTQEDQYGSQIHA